MNDSCYEQNSEFHEYFIPTLSFSFFPNRSIRELMEECISI